MACLDLDLRRGDVAIVDIDRSSKDVIPMKIGIHASVHILDASRMLAHRVDDCRARH